MLQERPDLGRYGFADARLLAATGIDEADAEFRCEAGEGDRSRATGRPRAGYEDVKMRQGLAGLRCVERTHDACRRDRAGFATGMWNGAND
jgi:hypothetical protein